MAKNRKKQTQNPESDEWVKKKDPVQELEQEEAAEIAAQRDIDEKVEQTKEQTVETAEKATSEPAAESKHKQDEMQKSSRLRQFHDKQRQKRQERREAHRKRHKWTMPIWLRVSGTLLLLAGLSIVFTWFVLWRSNLCDTEAVNSFIGEKPRLFAYSCMVIFTLMAALAAVTWRPFLSIGIAFAGCSIVSYIQMMKLAMRGVPLLPEDFMMIGNAGEIAQFVDRASVARLVGGVVLVLIGSALLEHCARRTIGRNTHQGDWWERYSIVPHVTFALMALAALTMVVAPIMQRRNYDWIEDEASFVEWNQSENYEKNGFILAFLYNFGQLEVKQPENYSESRMQEIARKYQALLRADTERVSLTDVADNVVIILDETFYDPALLTEYYPHTGGDVTPNLHKIFQKYPSGYMYSPEYGGGTANVEFAVMTGLSNYWAGITPYVNSIAKLDSRLSAAAWAKDYGFDTAAVHAYDGTMYKRNLVYARFGIDTFIDDSTMKYQEHDYESWYINDRSTFNEVLDLLKGNDDSQMVLAVTMMNHGSYDTARYPVLNYKIIGEENALLSANYQSIHMADKYLGEFLAEIDKLEERTVVLWFGDHAAGILSKYYNSAVKEESDLAQLTPYFIYANFDIESPWTVREVAEMNKELGFDFSAVKGVDLPVTSPNCLLNTMYNLLGVEKPALFYLVDEVCEEAPILVGKYLQGVSPEMTEALTNYQLVNYDVLAGKHYWDGE